jgi:hypothetical protein
MSGGETSDGADKSAATMIDLFGHGHLAFAA